MSELKDIFFKLSELYNENTLTWVEIAELYDVSKPNKDFNSENETIYAVKFIKNALHDPGKHLSAMMELCTCIRGLCGESRTTYYETRDCWKEILKAAGCDSYLAYIFGLSGLANLKPVCSNHIKLAMAAVSTYLLSLTIPGAKGFHIFDEEIIAHCMQIFKLTESLQTQDVVRRMSKNQAVEIWIHLTTLCDDLKLLLRYVHFKDNKNSRDNLLKKLINVLHLNHERGYANMYAANLHKNIFEIFDELINAHNGEPEETLRKLINMTALLHTYPPKPKNTTGTGFSSMSTETSCEHISDWFISRIAKYPRLLVNVLTFYIECMVTNPVKTWKTEQVQRALEYAAKYDAALFTKCNQSCSEFLCEAIHADEVMIRSRAVELITRILQLDSKVDWQMFRDEVSDIPREVHLVTELVNRICDSNNTIKLRSVQALQIALTKGSVNAQKIMTEGIKSARFTDCDVVLPVEPRVGKKEIRYRKPRPSTPNYTFEGHGLIELPFLNLPENIYKHIFNSSISNLRRAGIAFMEQLIYINPLIIFETKFVSRMLLFENDPTALVRKQAMLTADALLHRFPCYPILWVWCKILTPMLNDGDPKNTELAISCFHKRVLLNFKTLEQSNRAEHFMPWVILRIILSTSSRLYLQNCFNLALKQSLVNSQMLSVIESHLLTSNSTEAWIVLNFLSGKIKNKEPDALIHMFLSEPSWNKEQNMLIAIEVLANCIGHFSHTALNHAFTHILNAIRNGEMLPVLIGKAFDFLVLIEQQSLMQAKKAHNNKSSSINETWKDELHKYLENSIIDGINEFPHSRDTLISHLFSYTEVNNKTRQRPNNIIVSFIHKYMSECLKVEESEWDLENLRLFNSMIIIAGRLSIRDANVASATCCLYDSILRDMDHPPIVNTIIVAIVDICKKHTHIVERIIERMLSKLASPYIINRMETFKCFEKLVLQDQLKLRDTLLLSLFTALLDENEELVMRATNFFTEFTSKKNTTLFHKCLMEYPFILNEYKNFSSKDSFSEKIVKSSLKGKEQRKRRHSLYNYFMSEMDEVNLILYFNQLKFVADKCKDDPLMKTSEGIAVLKDVFFILKRVCQLTKEKKSTVENKGETDELADELTDLVETATEAQGAETSSTNKTASSSSGGGRGRGRRRNVISLEDALVTLEKSLIFIPNIYKLMHTIEPSLKITFDELCHVLAERFKNVVNEAQPTDFWQKYRKADKSVNKKKQCSRKRKSDSKTNIEVDDSTDDNSSDEEDCNKNVYASQNTEAIERNISSDCDSDDLPLIQKRDQPSPSKRMRTEHRETLLEYVFNPNI